MMVYEAFTIQEMYEDNFIKKLKKRLAGFQGDEYRIEVQFSVLPSNRYYALIIIWASASEPTNDSEVEYTLDEEGKKVYKKGMPCCGSLGFRHKKDCPTLLNT